MEDFQFPVGYHDLHKVKIFDFQLNRWHSWGYTSLQDMKAAAAKIRKLDDWKDALLARMNIALEQGRLLNAVFNCRAADFFVHPSDPDKKRIYDMFIDMFYNDLFEGESLERVWIPYEGAAIPAVQIPASGDNSKGPMVIHGGFDSYMEELLSCAVYFSNRGYDVLLFEGPGQGAALKEKGLYLDYRWEKPVKAVLDHFGLEECALLGFSMGGWFCFRAAAFEPRIKQVIASSIAYDYMQIPPKALQALANWFMKHPRLTEVSSRWKMKFMPQEKWGVENFMYITGKNSIVDLFHEMQKLNADNLKSELVKQDVLILTGDEDHFIPLKMHHMQVAALKNARSVEGRIFTRKEHAQNHCMIGNTGLMLAVIKAWLEKVKG
ncbi:alpha/beta hydrolase family protein [Desulfatibacillum aliphaticivorans]|uniref:alpha/beta hydrolase family protein n=1 Tax=Desulfatibacillum aliphaticivorans TaxID=218208 RepID=UPI00040644B9|nr:alpha/beta hydrolase [Desulfatibacillum aliphaticivorans]